MAGLFDLISADDLCAKLDHDYRRVKASPADVFAAFDFIMTAWHLLEWKHHGDGAREKRTALCQQYPVLGLCENLCVNGKHYEPTNPKHQSVQGTFRNSAWARGVWAPGVWAQDVWEDGLVIELAGAAKVALGERLSMEQFADMVIDFWRGPGGCPDERHITGSTM